MWVRAGVWMVLVIVGFVVVVSHDSAPGAPATAPARWPAEVALPVIPGTPTLVMLAHPRCPCTNASVHELARFLASATRRPTTYVLFIRPPGSPADFAQSELWQAAARIPGVTARVDADGALASRFGAATSGTVLLYDGAGQLRFNGGITSSRAHEGDNAGEDALMAALADATPLAGASVYGCELFEGGRR